MRMLVLQFMHSCPCFDWGPLAQRNSSEHGTTCSVGPALGRVPYLIYERLHFRYFGVGAWSIEPRASSIEHLRSHRWELKQHPRLQAVH